MRKTMAKENSAKKRVHEKELVCHEFIKERGKKGKIRQYIVERADSP